MEHLTFNYFSEADKADTGETIDITVTTNAYVLGGPDGVLAGVQRFLESVGFRFDRLEATVESETLGTIVHSSKTSALGESEYDRGYDEGFADGQAFSVDPDSIFNEAYEEGYCNGHSDGYADAHEDIDNARIAFEFGLV